MCELNHVLLFATPWTVAHRRLCPRDLTTLCSKSQNQILWWVVDTEVVQCKVKNPPASAGDAKDLSLIPGLGRSLVEGNGNPLQHSCLRNPMDRGAWRATVPGVTESQTWLSDWAHTNTHKVFQGQSRKLISYSWVPAPKHKLAAAVVGPLIYAIRHLSTAF